MNPRKFYCASCNLQDEGVHVSNDWYIVRQGQALVGIYCCINCIQVELDLQHERDKQGVAQ